MSDSIGGPGYTPCENRETDRLACIDICDRIGKCVQVGPLRSCGGSVLDLNGPTKAQSTTVI